MDNFVKYLKKIKKIAEKMSFKWNDKFPADELVNAAWLGYDKAIINKPSLAHETVKKSHFLRKIKCLMIDYIRDETKYKLQQVLVKEGEPLTTFMSCTQDSEEGEMMCVSFDSVEHGYEYVDHKDFLDRLFNQVLLEDVDWFIIQSYFYDERLLTEIGTDLDLTEATVCTRKNNALKKLRREAERMSS